MRPITKPLLELTAADLMTAPVTTLPHDMPLREAARLLWRSNISGAPVVDADGRCLGVLSSSDFVRWAGKRDDAQRSESVHFIAPWGEVIDIDERPDHEIRNFMTAQPVTASPAAPIGELAQMMVDAHIHRILVVAEQDRPCGVVTGIDVLAAVAGEVRKAGSGGTAGPRRRRRVSHEG